MKHAFDENADLLEIFSPGAAAQADEKRSVFPDLMDHVVDSIYGFAYRRQVLDIKTRHLVSLGILAALGGCEAQLDYQLKAALNLGLTADEVREVFIQVAVLAGNARATTVARQFHTILSRLATPSPDADHS